MAMDSLWGDEFVIPETPKKTKKIIEKIVHGMPYRTEYLGLPHIVTHLTVKIASMPVSVRL